MAELIAYRASDGRTVRVQADDEGNLIIAGQTAANFTASTTLGEIVTALEKLTEAVEEIAN